MSDSLYRQWGAVALPLAATSEADLSSLDPARDILLELFAAALISELTPRWANAVAGTPLVGNQPVQSKLPAIPDLDAMRQVYQAFPLLAVGRTDDPQTEDELTLWQNRITSRWSVNYILGPLELGNQLKLGDVLTEAARILSSVLHAGGHKAYATTTNEGQVFAKQVLGAGASCCYFSTLKVVNFMQGAAAFSQGGPKYHALTYLLETTELETDVRVGTPLVGRSFSLGLDGDGGSLPGFMRTISRGGFSSGFSTGFRVLGT
jgi:hypothetical protein